MSLCCLSTVLALLVTSSPLQEGPAAARTAATTPTTAPAQAEGAAPAGAFPAEQLEQIVAPIALYPDALLAQVLMASTYPLEIVEAARWVQKNRGLTGERLEAALKHETWDPSVKALCGLPDLLKRMSDNLEWTQDLGDAFLGQQAAVMDAVQTMRRKALEAGQLESSKEMTVTEQADRIIVIEEADPEVVYVPTYYPSAVYGSWGYPHWYYPPLYPPPPAGGVWFGFAAGVFWGAAIWGGCSWGWGHTEIDIDIDRQNNFIDRTEVDARRQEVKNRASSGGREWKHDPSHRKGVGYKDGKVAQRYGAGAGQTRVSRDQARGFGASPTTRPDAGRGAADRAAPRPDAGRGASDRRATSRSPQSTGLSSGSFSGSRSPSLDRAGSSRGAASRGSLGSRGARGGRGGRR